MRNISIVAIAFLIILCYSCDKESSENALTKDKMVGSWIWTNENGETVQVDTNKVDLNIGNCPEQMHFKEIITRETIWEFELDGDFEEKLYYNNTERDYEESKIYCEERYKNVVYTRETIGSWALENNDQGLEIKQKSSYNSDTIYHDYLIFSLTEERLILEKDDINKTKVVFIKWN